MKNKLLFCCCLSICTFAATAQTEQIFRQASQQYILYEAERDKGNELMYDYLIECYNLYVKVLDQQPASQYTSVAKARLVSLYPDLYTAFAYYSNSGNYKKSYQFGLAYIKLPRHQAMVSELLERDANYSRLLFNTGVIATEMEDDKNAINCLREYLQSDETTDAKDCLNYLIIVYTRQGDLKQKERILHEAIRRYPNDINFRYELVNLYIIFHDNTALSNALDDILSIDPYNQDVLPMKARLLMNSGNLKGAQEIYRQIYSFNQMDTVVMRDLAICDYCIFEHFSKQLSPDSDEKEVMHFRQEVYPYASEAREIFEKLLEVNPVNYDYIRAVRQCYIFFNMDNEAQVSEEIIKKRLSYVDFHRLLDSMTNNATMPAPSPISDRYPKLFITDTSLKESNNNNALDGGEAFTIEFTVENQGDGPAEGVEIRLGESGLVDRYITGNRKIEVGTIPANSRRTYSMNCMLDQNATNDTARMTIYVLESHHLDARPVEINILVKEMLRPRLSIAASQFFAKDRTEINRGDEGKLLLYVQNLGTGPAINTRIDFSCPDDVIPTGDKSIVFDSIPSGGYKEVSFSFLVTNRFNGDTIPISASVKEASSLLADTYKCKLGNYLPDIPIIIVPNPPTGPSPEPEPQELVFNKSELFDSIPEGEKHEKRYALIIGNEFYAKEGQTSQINVQYAVNDAMAFREYCHLTFGIPYENIRYIANATKGTMQESMMTLINTGMSDSEAELFFYYSGHGAPDEKEKKPYLLPVDLSGKNPQFGISLYDFYKNISSCGCKGAYIFLDACFSGGYKSERPLIETKGGIIIIDDLDKLQGNTVSFTSSSGNETSSVYHEKKHGLFTYFLLKTIKDSKGDITLGELYDRTRKGVLSESSKMGKPQSPQFIPSYEWADWASFKLCEKLSEKLLPLQSNSKNRR